MKINYEDIKQLNDFVNKNIDVLSKETYQTLQEDFDIKFTHESTKIEGNTLSISEVKTILVDNISIGGKELREIYEVVNNKKAYRYILNELDNKSGLTEDFIKDIHEIVMDNIIQGGIYRNYNVRISGASFRPVDWEYVRSDMKAFISQYNEYKGKIDPIKLASYTHGEFVKIHPFPDGNGRTARLLLNYVLIDNDYRPVIIQAIDRPQYYESLDSYATENNLEGFYDLVLKKEYSVLKEFKDEIDKIKDINLNKGKSR